MQERLDKEENQGAAGWKEICSPSSPFIKGDPTTQAPREAKRFIYNLHKTLDHCTNPDNVPLHGTYIFQHYGAVSLALVNLSAHFCSPLDASPTTAQARPSHLDFHCKLQPTM